MQSNDGMFTLEVLVNGRPVREYPHAGETLVEGIQGAEYTLRVRNNSRRRAVAVLSVDGLSVMTGKPATSGDSGYILPRYSPTDIPGWRLNNQAVAKFEFAALPEAYASMMGQPTNIGVIGAAFFYENYREPEVLSDDLLESFGTRGGPPQTLGGGTFRGATRGGSAPRSKGVGTGFGQQASHLVQQVHFDREPIAAATLAIRYDDREGLIARGIMLGLPNDRVMNANPFPADGPGATPPPGWNPRGRR